MTEGLVTIATYHSPAEAHIVQSMLGAKGVFSFLAEENTAEMFQISAASDVRLQVYQTDLPKAEEVLHTCETHHITDKTQPEDF